ncbi:MAG: hypothetical protein WAU34_07790, partial [Desulfobacterales bacterium]
MAEKRNLGFKQAPLEGLDALGGDVAPLLYGFLEGLGGRLGFLLPALTFRGHFIDHEAADDK